MTTATQDQTHVRVVTGVISVTLGAETRYFMQQRTTERNFPWLWECPGGKVEPDDASLRAALFRELDEEINLAAAECSIPEEPFLVTTFRKGEIPGITRDYTLHFFRVDVSPEVAPCDARDALGHGWFTLDQMHAMRGFMIPGNVRLVDHLRAADPVAAPSERERALVRAGERVAEERWAKVRNEPMPDCETDEYIAAVDLTHPRSSPVEASGPSESALWKRYKPKTPTQILGYLVEECGEVLAAAASVRAFCSRLSTRSVPAPTPRRPRSTSALAAASETRAMAAERDKAIAELARLVDDLALAELDKRALVSEMERLRAKVDAHPGLMWQDINGRLREAHLMIAVLVARLGGKVEIKSHETMEVSADEVIVTQEAAGMSVLGGNVIATIELRRDPARGPSARMTGSDRGLLDHPAPDCDRCPRRT